MPGKRWIQALRKKCDDTGTLLVLDEIQCAFGRNGTLWAFEQFDVVPDVLLREGAWRRYAIGAFIADKNSGCPYQ